MLKCGAKVTRKKIWLARNRFNMKYSMNSSEIIFLEGNICLIITTCCIYGTRASKGSPSMN